MSSLNQLAIRGTLWTIISYGASQALRLGSNLILTRLLVPEMFGLMALVNIFFIGLNLFSDIGIGPSIIQNPRGNEPQFLNTAWTIQVIRGFVLWLVSLIIAKPLADFYNDSQLFWLIPIICFSTVIAGFNSTNLFTLNRKIALAKLTQFELFIQILGLIITITWAIISPTIWALVAGNLMATLIKMIGSHFLVKETRNHFAWDKTALEELVNFGRWIFISTAMTFLATQADRLILGKLFPLEILGVYTVAYTFSDIPRQVINQLKSKVMFPVISQKINLPPSELKQELLKKRWLLLMIILWGLMILICFGDRIIITLYDSRYHQGAWMLPLLAIGLWPAILTATIDPVLYALGKPQFNAIGNFGKFIYMLIALPLAYHIWGILGTIIVVSANDIPTYLAVNYGLWKNNLSGLRQDILATFLLFVLVSILLWIRWKVGLSLPFKGEQIA